MDDLAYHATTPDAATPEKARPFKPLSTPPIPAFISDMKKRGLTLVELLMAIAILAILAAISIPYVRSSIEKGQAAKCMANLKDLGVLINSYAVDKEHYPPHRNSAGPYPPWYELENWSGIKDSPSWLCPSRLIKSVPSGATITTFTPAYSANTRVFTATGLRVAGVPRPSQVIALIDAGQQSRGVAFHQLTVPDTAANNPANADRPLTGAPIAEPNTDITTTPCVRYRHQGCANALFVDGHVEPKKLGTILEKNISVSY